MKPTTFILIAGICLATHGAMARCIVHNSGACTKDETTIPDNCKTYASRCVQADGITGTHGFYTCTECQSGYALVNDSMFSGCTGNGDDEGDIYRRICRKLCTETDWTAQAYNAESRYVCTDTYGDATQQFRCQSGYYDIMNRGVAACASTTFIMNTSCVICTQCPQRGFTTTGYPASIPGSTEGEAACFYRSGTYTDTTGTFDLNSDCNYQK